MRTEKIQNNNSQRQKRNKIKAIKTYRDYAVDSLKGKSTSLARMIIDEKKTQEIKSTRTITQKKNIFMLSISGGLIFLGVISLIGIIFFSLSKNNYINNSTTLSVISFVKYDSIEEIDLTTVNYSKMKEIMNNFIERTIISKRDIKILYFSIKNENETKRVITAREFIKILDTRIPVQLDRTLLPDFTVGLKYLDSNLPFFIFKINSFDLAYIKMQEWEKTILFDLGPFLKVNKRFYSQNFVDLNLHNIDTRVILNEEKEIVFGYSFLDMKTLVFFTNAAIFETLKLSIKSQQERK